MLCGCLELDHQTVRRWKNVFASFYDRLVAHYNNTLEGNPTTTCALESWHRSINAATRSRGYSMWKILNLFKSEIGRLSFC